MLGAICSAISHRISEALVKLFGSKCEVEGG